MSVFLPIAGMSISLPLIVGIGLTVGFLSGLLGVGGGFLQSPALIMAGIPPTVATASGATAIIATASSGSAAHVHLGHVDFKLGLLVVPGGLLGGAIGVHVIRLLRLLGDADILIISAYIILLASVGGSMLLQCLRRRGRLPLPRTAEPRKTFRPFDCLPFQTAFPRSGIRRSVLLPFLMGMVIGILTAIMGVGGGFLMVPMMVYLLGVPVHVAIGTDLFQILMTCSGVAFLQSTENHTVDLLLVLLLATGSTIGAQIGARVGRRLNGSQLIFLLAVLMLVVMVKMLVGIILPPAELLQLAAMAVTGFAG